MVALLTGDTSLVVHKLEPLLWDDTDAKLAWVHWLLHGWKVDHVTLWGVVWVATDIVDGGGWGCGRLAVTTGCHRSREQEGIRIEREREKRPAGSGCRTRTQDTIEFKAFNKTCPDLILLQNKFTLT